MRPQKRLTECAEHELKKPGFVIFFKNDRNIIGYPKMATARNLYDPESTKMSAFLVNFSVLITAVNTELTVSKSLTVFVFTTTTLEENNISKIPRRHEQVYHQYHRHRRRHLDHRCLFSWLS